MTQNFIEQMREEFKQIVEDSKTLALDVDDADFLVISDFISQVVQKTATHFSEGVKKLSGVDGYESIVDREDVQSIISEITKT